MQIIFEDGFIKEVPFGQQLCGVQKNRKRPVEIKYSQEEIDSHEWIEEKKQRYIHTVLKNAVQRTANH